MQYGCKLSESARAHQIAAQVDDATNLVLIVRDGGNVRRRPLYSGDVRQARVLLEQFLLSFGEATLRREHRLRYGLAASKRGAR